MFGSEALLCARAGSGLGLRVNTRKASLVGKNQVARAIDRAFSGTAYPGDRFLAGRPVDIDNLGHELPDEYLYVAKYFRGRLWQSITLRDLEAAYAGPAGACLNFMSRKAARYYLPAFM